MNAHNMPEEELQFPFDEDFVDPLDLIVTVHQHHPKKEQYKQSRTQAKSTPAFSTKSVSGISPAALIIDSILSSVALLPRSMPMYTYTLSKARFAHAAQDTPDDAVSYIYKKSSIF